MVRGRAKGSFTVEAAFILPLIIFIIFTLVYLAFYLHDRNRMEGIVDQVLHKGAITVKHDADFDTGRVDYANIGNRGVLYPLTDNRTVEEKKIRDYLRQELSTGFFSTELTGIEVMVDAFKVSVTIEGEFHIPMKGILQYFYPGRNITVNALGPIHNPAEFIRISEVVLDTGSRIKGLEDLKDKTDKLLGK